MSVPSCTTALLQTRCCCQRGASLEEPEGLLSMLGGVNGPEGMSAGVWEPSEDQ